MKNDKRRSVIFALLTAAAALFLSCQSTGSGGTADERALSRGRNAWNGRGPEAARSSWIAIKDKTLRDRQLGYIGSYAAAEKSLSEAEAAPATGHDRVLASWQRAQRGFSSIPNDLALPKALKARGNALAETRMRALIDSGRPAAARDMGEAALDLFGSKASIKILFEEARLAAAARKAQDEASGILASARLKEDFDAKIDLFERAAKAYAAAEDDLSRDAKKAGVPGKPGVTAAAASLKRARQASTVEKEKLLRERAYAFRERIGEAFARQSEGGAASQGLEGLKRHQESVRAELEGAYREMEAFAARYPAIVTAAMLRDARAQKAVLDEKIAKIDQEIRTARDIASRGKPVIPLMIGLFNPQPGPSAAAKKSRPAVFSGTAARGSQWWWGMVSIEPGAMNDLVITMADSRPLRVFADNTLSGMAIEKKGLKDLVNRAQKVGNSWPMLNAGARLSEGRWFLEVQEGRGGAYEGEAVVYDSFISRMR